MTGFRTPSRRLAGWAWVGLIAAPLLGPAATAAPSIPPSDATVLERLPDPGPASREARALAAALARDPTDLDLALRLARLDIARGQTFADPRFFGRAEAALAPWIADPPPPVRLLRGVLRQSSHDFDGALADLTEIVDTDGGSALAAQARLTRAVVHQVRAEYADARDDCGAVVAALPPPAGTACIAGVASLTGHARQSVVMLTMAAASPVGLASARVWALTLLGETAARLDDAPTALHAFAQARELAPDDSYLLGATADLLLDLGRPAEVVDLLADRTRVDPLLLRLAEAERALGRPDAGYELQLAERFETSRRRGDTVHRREEARFTLHILGKPTEALALAEANWAVQREPADARILLEAAAAAGQPGRGAPARDWFTQNGVEDVRLAALVRAP